MLHLPNDEALDLGRKFHAGEPSTVLVSVDTTEKQWIREARRGEDSIIGLLKEYCAAWALVRQWAGHDTAVAPREAEIQRLERLVWDALYALQKAGLDRRSRKTPPRNREAMILRWSELLGSSAPSTRAPAMDSGS